MTKKMPPSAALGEAIGGFLGLAIPIGAVLALLHRASAHRWLQVLIFTAGLIVAFMAMIACSVPGNGAAGWWNNRKSASQAETEKQDFSS